MTGLDLYSILVEYSLRAKTPKIPLIHFQNNLIAAAKYKARKHPAWKVWTVRPRERFKYSLEQLVNEEKITIEFEGEEEYINVPAFYVERVREMWASVNNDTTLPFPGGVDAKEEIPETLIKNIDFETEFLALLKNPPEKDLPILRIIFPDNAGSALASPSLVSTLFLEGAVFKLNRFLTDGENFPYLLTKVCEKNSAMVNQVNNVLKMTAQNPADCVSEIEKGNESALPVLISLCQTIIEYLAAKNIKTEADIAVLQSVYVINVFCLYYKDAASANDGTEQYIEALNENFSRPPYIYSIAMIYKFTDSTGCLLTGKYSTDVLVKALKKMTAVRTNSPQLPATLTFYDDLKNQWLVLKEKVYHCFDYIIAQNRIQIQKIIVERWKKRIRDYDDENAMKHKESFEALVIKVAAEEKFLLTAIYSNKKFILAKNELEFDFESLGLAHNYFNEHTLIPLHEILGLDRRLVKNEALRQLPLWYSIPILVSLIKLFRTKKRG